jgi:hypothetical protein
METKSAEQCRVVWFDKVTGFCGREDWMNKAVAEALVQEAQIRWGDVIEHQLEYGS